MRKALSVYPDDLLYVPLLTSHRLNYALTPTLCSALGATRSYHFFEYHPGKVIDKIVPERDGDPPFTLRDMPRAIILLQFRRREVQGHHLWH